MGCGSSSDSFQPKEYDNKAIVWFLGGGPGSPKQQVTEVLADKYKFKYLSAMELVRFEESAVSQEGTEIRLALEQKAELSSDLILRVLQKVIVLYGPRKYLIDSFPRNMQDVTEFETLCKKHPELQFQGYLQLQLNEEQMKESGVKTLTEIKKEASKEDIEKEVRTIIEGYRAKSKTILQYYHSKQQLITADFPNGDALRTITQIQSQLGKKKCHPVHNVPFLCINGNEQKEIYAFGLRLARLFNLNFWSIDQLKEQFSSRPQVAKYLSETKGEVEGSFLVDLIKRKMEKYNYKGRYLISGFPRDQRDVLSLRGALNREISLIAYTGCLHTPVTEKEKEAFENLHHFLSQEEETHSTLINSTETSFAQITDHIQKVMPTAKYEGTKVILFPTFGAEGEEYFKKMEEWCEVANFDDIVSSEAKQQKFASGLLSSCISLKKPVPSYFAAKVFDEKVDLRAKQQEGTKVIVFKGFPQNIEQLKVVLARSKSVLILCGMFVEASRIRKNIKSPNQAELGAYQQLCGALQASCDKNFKVSERTTYQQVKTYLTSL